MFFHMCISFLLFLIFPLASLFFHVFCSFLYTCAFLVRLLCSPFLQSLQSFVLHLRVPTTNIVFLFTCFLAGMLCTSGDEEYSGAAIVNRALPNQLVLAPVYDLVAGCFFCLPDLRRELISQALGTSLVQAVVVLWSSRFC